MAGSSILFANNAISTLAGAITNTATAAFLAAGTGALFPNPTGGNFYVGTFNDAATGLLYEIVHVTEMSGDEIAAMARAQEGTIAQDWAANDLFQNRWTAGQAAAMVQYVQYQPARIITTSGAFTISQTDDFFIGLQRASSLADSASTLPNDANAGQQFVIADLQGNFQAYPVTISPPAGFNIANLTEVVLNVNRQSATFTYYGDDTYGYDAGT